MPLVTSKEMFEKAYNGGYAIGAFNVNNMEIVQGITEACQEEHAPVILQVSKGARAYANHTYLVKLVEAAVECCPDIPIVLHLDHGPDFETCKSCIDGGFTSVMIDASSKPFVLGKANVLREGKDVAIFATGLMVNESLLAADELAKDGIDAAVINVHTIKPIDVECVTAWAEKCGKVITVEEHSVIGGLGDAVADVLMGKVNCKFHKIGVNDQFGQSGKAADVLREYGLTADQIAATIKANI